MKLLITSVLFILNCFCALAQEATTVNSIQLVRNATLVINYAGQRILLDPMLSPKGALGCWSGKGETPSVDLKLSINEITKNLDFVLITHAHVDHFDKDASSLLNKSLKVFCQHPDKHFFLNQGFRQTEAIIDSVMYNGITIVRVNAQHGTGKILKAMGEASGFILKAFGQPTIYIIGDSVWTQEIASNIEKYNPDYIVVNSGGAIMPGGYDATPIIMDERQVMALIQESGTAKIIAVHMDAVDHCRTTRYILRKEAQKRSVNFDKLIIPKDCDVIKL